MGILTATRRAIAGAFLSVGKGIAPAGPRGQVDSAYGSGDLIARYLLDRVPKFRSDPSGLAQAAQASIWAYRCIAKRAQVIADLDWQVVYKGTDTPVGADNPFDRSLWWAYKQFDQDVVYNLEWGLQIWGEAYFEKLVNDQQRPGGLRWLNPQAVTPWVQNGRLKHYEYNAGDQYINLAPSRVFYNRLPNTQDDIRGHSPLVTALIAVNVDRSAARFIQAFYDNDATPGGVLTTRNDVILSRDEQDRLIEQWTSQLKGASNSYRVVALPHPVEFTSYDTKAPDTQLGMKEETRREISAAFGVPMSMINAGGVSDPLSAGGTMDAQKAEAYENEFLPTGRLRAKWFNAHVMPWLAPGMELKIDDSKIMSLIYQTEARANMVNVQVGGPVMTVNEGREKSGLDPLPNGDVFYVPAGVNVIPADQLHEAVELTRPDIPPGILAAVNGAEGGNVTAMLDHSQVMPQVERFAPAQLPPLAKAEDMAAYVYLSMANHPHAIEAQTRLRNVNTDPRIKWVDPALFHITLGYTTDIAADGLDSVIRDISPPQEFYVKGGEYLMFDTPDGWAVHIPIEPNTALGNLQSETARLLAAYQSGTMPAYFAAGYKPHVTLCYVPKDTLPTIPTGKQFTALIDRVVIARSGYRVVAILRFPPTPELPPPANYSPEFENKTQLEPTAQQAKLTTLLGDEALMDKIKAAVLDELAQWKRFALNRVGKSDSRQFVASVIPDSLASDVNATLQHAESPDEIKAVFDMAYDSVGLGVSVVHYEEAIKKAAITEDAMAAALDRLEALGVAALNDEIEELDKEESNEPD